MLELVQRGTKLGSCGVSSLDAEVDVLCLFKVLFVDVAVSEAGILVAQVRTHQLKRLEVSCRSGCSVSLPLLVAHPFGLAFVWGNKTAEEPVGVLLVDTVCFELVGHQQVHGLGQQNEAVELEGGG